MLKVHISGTDDLKARILSLLQEKGFSLRETGFGGPYIGDTPVSSVLVEFYRELAGDIADGKTAWPVDPGRTHLLFTGGPDGLSNIYHDAAQDVERSTNAIASYIDNNLPESTAQAYAYAGVPSAIRNAALSAKQLTRFMQAVDIADRKAAARDKNKHD